MGRVLFAGVAATFGAVTVAAVAQPLDVAVTASPNPARPGDRIQYEVTIHNRGAETISAVEAEMPFSDGWNWFIPGDEFDGAACADETCGPGDLLTWAIGDLPPGGVRKRVFIRELFGVETGDAVETRVAVTAPLVSDASAVCVVGIDESAAVDVRLDASADPTRPGEIIWLVAQIGVSGDAALEGGELRLTLPAGVTFVSANESGVLFTDQVVWSLPRMTAGTSVERVAAVSMDSGATPGSVARFGASVDAGSGTLSSAEKVVGVSAAPDLRVTARLSPDPVRSDHQPTLTFTVTNLGSAPVSNVRVRMPFPDGWNWFLDNSRTNGGGCAGGGCGRGQLVRWSLGDLASGASHTVVLANQLFDRVDGDLLHVLVAATADDVATDASGSATVAIADARPLTMALTTDASTVTPGGTVTATIHYANHAGETLRDAVARLELPPGVNSARTGGQVIEWSLGDLSSAEGGALTEALAVDAAVTRGSALLLKASIGSEETTSGTLPRARDDVWLQVHDRVDLSLVAIAGPSRLSETESQITYEVVVRNESAATLQDVTLAAPFASGWNWFISNEDLDGGGCPGGSCGRADVLAWALGDLAPGAARIVLFSVQRWDVSAGELVAGTFVANSPDAVASAKATAVTEIETVRDEAVSSRWYRDSDGDGFGDPGFAVDGPTQPTGFVDVAGDCNDADAAVNPAAAEVCGDDVDENCDGLAAACSRTWYRDADGDGFGTASETLEAAAQPAGYVAESNDCDDADAAVNPAASESCGDGVDQDCDGMDASCPAPVGGFCPVVGFLLLLGSFFALRSSRRHASFVDPLARRE